MTRLIRSVIPIFIAALLLTPAIARAQGASIAGVVKDSSGAVLPGVTVEASSPVLIEKTRTAVTDGRGAYEIINLRPGDYTVTFTLTGFSTVKREGITLTGSFTATVDGELRVGSLEESLTVTGAAPIVDLQNATRQRVVNAEVIDALPTSRVHSSLATLIPGISATKPDIGGTTFSAGFMQGHGTHGDDSRIFTDGISVAAFRGKGAGGQTTPDVGAMQEMTFDYSGASAENTTGGIRVNLIPREGGNTFKASSFFSFANASMQNNNLSSALIGRGYTAADSVKVNYDFNPGFGGPIMKDKLWYYATWRQTQANNYVGGLYVNKNAGNPNAWTFDPDTSRQVWRNQWWKDAQLRLTYQATPRNKISASLWTTPTCQCSANASATLAEEASTWSSNDPWYQTLINYQSPLTSRLLLEATGFYRFDVFTTNRNDDFRNPLLVPINIQSNGLSYRATPQFQRNQWKGAYYRVALSYVTGTHNVKVGFNNQPGALTDGILADNPLSYRVSAPLVMLASPVNGRLYDATGGVPNQLTLRATPYYPIYNVDRDMGIFAQDRWTLSRVTFTYGLRFDQFKASYPVQNIAAAPLAPNRNITFPATPGENWKDIEPKTAVSFDLFGNQKTALKASLNKYVAGNGSGGLTTTLNPFTSLVSSTTRSWTDTNGNLVPDCNILSPAAQSPATTGSIDTCGAMNNPNFGTNIGGGTTVDPNLQSGWGKREYNWEFSTGVQHEVTSNLSAEVSYFRRWYGNFQVADDLNHAATDYDSFSIIAPTTTPFLTASPTGASTAPSGVTTVPNAGQTITGLYNVTPGTFSTPSNLYWTLSDNYGKMIEHWNGVDVMVSARLPYGLRVQGGTSTGKTVMDYCAVRAKVPEVTFTPAAPTGAPAASLTNPWCHIDSGFLTEFKGFATYTIPKADVLVSGTFQDAPGPLLQSNFVATNAVTQPSLGRVLSGGAANVTVPLFAPGVAYGDRLYQLDMRFGKVVKFQRMRAVVNFDIFNALNQNTVLTENASFAVWRQPTSILMARFYKVGLQFDF